uniref:Ig-like domain-containing protein n=1 Tax=Astyanax mexicanus TaxID=7994 RepID=A0A3B1IJT7_ASTMX
MFNLLLYLKTSNDGLQVQTEKIGENVTIKCEESFIKDNHQYSFAWYKQSYGKLPQLVVRLVNFNSNVRYTQEFQQRFNATLKGDQFFLNINETVEEDSGIYFCGRVKTDVTKFGSGTLLIFNGKIDLILIFSSNVLDHILVLYAGDCTGQMFILMWLSIVRTAVVAGMLFIIAVIYSVKKIKK